MPNRPRVTDLSVTFTDRRGLQSTVFELGSGDVETLALDAEETVTVAVVDLVNLNYPDVSVGSGSSAGTETGLVNDVTLVSDVAFVKVSGLTRDVYYELSVTFTAGTRKWTRTLFLYCPT